MLTPLFKNTLILSSCKNSQLVITANRRLCQKVLDAWGYQQQNDGEKQWHRPPVFSLEQWIEEQWQQLQTEGYKDSFKQVVSADEQRILWEKITQDCGRMQPEKLAAQAATAFKQLHQWQLPLTQLKSYINDKQSEDIGVSLFYRWCLHYQKSLDRHQLITAEQRLHIIIQAFFDKVLKKEKTIDLLGFDSLSPLLQKLLESAGDSLNTILNTEHTPQSISRKCYSTPAEEMLAASLWAKSILEKNSDVRIGIITPNLGQCRQQVLDALCQILEPQSRLIITETYTLPFNISAGTPLGQTPFITETLQLLKSLQKKWSLDECCRWLFSPYWGKFSSDMDHRSTLASHLQALEKFIISDNDLRFYAEKVCTSDAVKKNAPMDNEDSKEQDKKEKSLFGYLSELRHLQTTYSSHAKPSEWVNRFLEILNTLCWPGERQPSSIEYQQTEAFYQLLERFARLDVSLGSLTLVAAVNELSTMANSTPFQAQVPDSPIQVLGILEGVGLHFTHCWVMGLHQYAWPAPASPNPLLPFDLQKQYGMPHASALRELEYAQSLTQHYRHCADEIILSSPQYENDGDIPWLPSTLINDIALDEDATDLQSSNPYRHYIQALAEAQKLSAVHCSEGPALKFSEDTHVLPLKGGASVLKAVAENPFDAFASYRLHARSPNLPVSGFSSLEQGNILHQSLANIWIVIKSQAQLKQLSDTALTEYIQNAVRENVMFIQKRKRDHLKETLCELEIERQTQLLFDWCQLEKERPPFTVVGIEESLSFTLNNVKIDFRLDRVDRLEDGSHLIIDYKTGLASTSSWKGERPSDPQLPLYLLAYHQNVSGIAFAQINIKGKTLKGLHDGQHSIETMRGLQAIGDNRLDIPPTWEDAKQHWGSILQQLLDDYLGGDCRILLKNAAGFKKELLPLNRFYEAEQIKEWLRNNLVTH